MKTFFLCATVLIALPAWAQLRCLDKLLCSPDEIVATAEASCAQFEAGNPDAIVCNQPTILGHFTVTIDTQRNANVVFHKQRRPARRD